jgi:hypothetical protein
MPLPEEAVHEAAMMICVGGFANEGGSHEKLAF